jgi:hypothetical protein
MGRVTMRGLVTATAIALTLGAGGAGAEEPGDDSGLVTVAGDASASGVRFSYEVPAEFLAATTPVDGGGPVAQASVGSGLARSAASLPFPGELVIAGPGLFYLVTGMTIPGAYPFYVAAEHPTAPESELGDPSGQYQLSAKATGRSASSLAQAVFGPPEQGSGGSRTATAIESAADGSAVATAESVTHSLSFGDGVLRIAAVRSTSVSRLAPDGTKAETDRSLVVEGATVGGQPVTIDARGVHAGSAAAPVPFGSSADQVSSALAQSGVAARILSEDDGTGGSTEVLEVRSRHPLPFAGDPEGVFTWRIGKAATTLVRTGFLPVPETATESAAEQPAESPGLPAAGLGPGSAPAPAVLPPMPSRLAPAPAGDRGRGVRALPVGYDPGPLPLVFEDALAEPADAAGAATEALAAPGDPAPAPATVLAAPAAATRPAGLGRMQLLYGAVALGASLIAGLSGLWWKKGVSWPGS